ncbi:MAG: VOC family protein [Gemmiger sp.]|nr:VOC family protein [Gemmiger sp.]
MDIKENFTGVQHIGIPTNAIHETAAFYHKLGFETALDATLATTGDPAMFLKLGNLVIETYENHAAAMAAGAIDHIAIDVRSIDDAYDFICKNNLNNTNDSIHFLPFWENGVKFFTIEGPNKEKIEFSQML